MVSKTGVVLSLFVFMVLLYFMYMLVKLIKEKKQSEPFAEAATTSTTKTPAGVGKNADNITSDKQLDMNLYVINTFEEVQGRKITTPELKQFTDAYANGDVKTKADMKAKIEAFKSAASASASAAASSADSAAHLADLMDIHSKLSSVIQTLQSQGGSGGSSGTIAKLPTPGPATPPVTSTKTPPITIPSIPSAKPTPGAATTESFTQHVMPFSAPNKYMTL